MTLFKLTRFNKAEATTNATDVQEALQNAGGDLIWRELGTTFKAQVAPLGDSEAQSSTGKGSKITAHKHAAIIKQWAEGAIIQYRNRGFGAWYDCVDNRPSWVDTADYRVKPKTIKYKRYLARFGDGARVLSISPIDQKAYPRETFGDFIRWIDTEWQDVEV